MKKILAYSVVIDDTDLMQNRFGSMATQDPKDKLLKFTQQSYVYWDLFRVGNQNWPTMEMVSLPFQNYHTRPAS